MNSKIIRIGKDAVSEKEPILVLFGENASTAIEDVSVLQSFNEKPADFRLKNGDEIVIGEQIYTIEHIGKNVNHNLQSLGHITLIFQAFNPERFLETSVYVSPYQLPQLKVGMEIKYQSK